MGVTAAVRRSAPTRFSAARLPRRLGSRVDPPSAAGGRRRLHAVCRSRRLRVGDAAALGAEPGGRRRQPDVPRAARQPRRADQRARHPRARDRGARARRDDRAGAAAAGNAARAGRPPLGAGGARDGSPHAPGAAHGHRRARRDRPRGREDRGAVRAPRHRDPPPRRRAGARRRRSGVDARPPAGSPRAERRRGPRRAAYARDQAADRARADRADEARRAAGQRRARQAGGRRGGHCRLAGRPPRRRGAGRLQPGAARDVEPVLGPAQRHRHAAHVGRDAGLLDTAGRAVRRQPAPVRKRGAAAQRC